MQYFKIFLKFLSFGLLAWGGPVAQIGMLRKELVEKEGWISSEKFNRVLAIYQALPGPEAHELCVYMGMIKAGRIGAILAGLGFMLPGVLLMILLAWCYQTIGATVLLPLFIGVKPAVAALIFRAAHRIGQHALSSYGLMFICLTAVVLTLLHIHFILILLICGVVQAFWGRQQKFLAIAMLVTSVVAAAIHSDFATTPVVPTHSATTQSAPLFIEGLKGGLLSFGGAYTAIPFLQNGMVGTAPNITKSVFLDSIAFANVIPAPLISFATFLGYISGGLNGALLITLGIFLPAFSFTLLGHRYLEKAVEYQPLHGFLDGITAGVVGILMLTAVDIFQQSVGSIATGIVFVCALASLYVFKSKWAVPTVILCAGIAGKVISL